MRAVLIALAALLFIASSPPARAQDRDGFGIDGDAIALAFSGGGARSAAFSYGVLQGLGDMRARDQRTLRDRVVFVSAVSGGAITAAYFGLNGGDGLANFRADYLDRDSGDALRDNAISPLNWARAASGGVNGPGRLGNWLSTNVFRNATMGDLTRADRPRIWINATELYNGVPFAFTSPYFDALCTDLDDYRIGDAVAASMSVPVVFHPVALSSQSQPCSAMPTWVTRAQSDRTAPQLLRATARAFQTYRDPNELRAVHLVDGGVIDNLGLSSILVARQSAATPIAPLSPRDAVRLTRFTFIVVNAEVIHTPTWSLTQEGPSGPEAISAALDASMDASKRAAFDALRTTLTQWQNDVRTFRCALPQNEVLRLRGTLDGWNCNAASFALDMISFADLPAAERDRLGIMATRVTLPRADIDALIAGGRRAIFENATVRALQ